MRMTMTKRKSMAMMMTMRMRSTMRMIPTGKLSLTKITTGNKVRLQFKSSEFMGLIYSCNYSWIRPYCKAFFFFYEPSCEGLLVVVAVTKMMTISAQ